MPCPGKKTDLNSRFTIKFDYEPKDNVEGWRNVFHM